MTVDKSGDRVKRMFGEIAPKYDLMNHVLSMNVDRYWRWRTVRLVQPKPAEPIPTAVGQPLPASAVETPSWPDPGTAGAAFEPNWPDIPTPRLAPDVAVPTSAPQAGASGLRRTGANLPSIDAPPLPIAARACPSCGLSLSASARFCRRCGTQQQVDAPR